MQQPVAEFEQLKERMELLQKDAGKHDSLYVILTTNGGSAEMVERYVNILRHHYTEINFIVPDYAYSAGTIFCMSGDSIYMDYFSVLGPIDPQVLNKEGKYIAAEAYNADEANEVFKVGGMHAMNLLYALHAYQIGACALNWRGEKKTDEKLRKLIGVQDNEEIIIVIAAGYPLEEFSYVASRRNSLEESLVVVN